ncbi:MAG: hypothetical protein WBE40_04685 [Thermoplasmata archaeon]
MEVYDPAKETEALEKETKTRISLVRKDEREAQNRAYHSMPF